MSEEKEHLKIVIEPEVMNFLNTFHSLSDDAILFRRTRKYTNRFVAGMIDSSHIMLVRAHINLKSNRLPDEFYINFHEIARRYKSLYRIFNHYPSKLTIEFFRNLTTQSTEYHVSTDDINFYLVSDDYPTNDLAVSINYEPEYTVYVNLKQFIDIMKQLIRATDNTTIAFKFNLSPSNRGITAITYTHTDKSSAMKINLPLKIISVRGTEFNLPDQPIYVIVSLKYINYAIRMLEALYNYIKTVSDTYKDQTIGIQFSNKTYPISFDVNLDDPNENLYSVRIYIAPVHLDDDEKQEVIEIENKLEG